MLLRELNVCPSLTSVHASVLKCQRGRMSTHLYSHVTTHLLVHTVPRRNLELVVFEEARFAEAVVLCA